MTLVESAQIVSLSMRLEREVLLIMFNLRTSRFEEPGWAGWMPKSLGSDVHDTAHQGGSHSHLTVATCSTGIWRLVSFM